MEANYNHGHYGWEDKWILAVLCCICRTNDGKANNVISTLTASRTPSRNQTALRRKTSATKKKTHRLYNNCEQQ